MNDQALAVLVLGLGGNVSQGILKALRMGALKTRVVGACTSAKAAGLFAADAARVSPLAADPDFLPWLLDLCRAEGIRAILSGVEPVLEVLSRHAGNIREETGAVAVVSPWATFEVGMDKLETCRWLEGHDLPHPRYADAADPDQLDRLVERCGWPLVAKPRRGRGSVGVQVVTAPSEVAALRGTEDYVVQEYLGSPAEEYSTGCFCDAAGGLRGSVVMRRELTAGTTTYAELGEFPEVRGEAERVATALAPLGPVNVQSRLHQGQPVTFEVNVRFSGTTPVRAHFGFNEVEAALRHIVLGEPAVDLPRPIAGTALRYWEEVYADPGAVSALGRDGALADPRGAAAQEGLLHHR